MEGRRVLPLGSLTLDRLGNCSCFHSIKLHTVPSRIHLLGRVRRNRFRTPGTLYLSGKWESLSCVRFKALGINPYGLKGQTRRKHRNCVINLVFQEVPGTAVTFRSSTRKPKAPALLSAVQCGPRSDGTPECATRRLTSNPSTQSPCSPHPESRADQGSRERSPAPPTVYHLHPGPLVTSWPGRSQTLPALPGFWAWLCFLFTASPKM